MAAVEPRPKLIALVGPTACGKSAAALDLAKQWRAEIVSCDSLQVYRGLDIGSAKPTPAERADIRHHLIDVVNPDEMFSAAEYARRAREAVGEIVARRRLPLVVGGTGLYLRALLAGLFEGPSRDASLRGRLDAIGRRGGTARLYRLLSRVDPDAAGRIAPRDRVRIVRALEVYRLTGRPISEQQRASTGGLEGFDVAVFGIDPDRRALRAAVEQRIDRMLALGWLDEVRALLSRYAPELRPLQAIGYRQMVAVARGELEVESARHGIVIATMRYAKRQMTWVRHQVSVRWSPSGEEALTRMCDWLRGPA